MPVAWFVLLVFFKSLYDPLKPWKKYPGKWVTSWLEMVCSSWKNCLLKVASLILVEFKNSLQTTCGKKGLVWVIFPDQNTDVFKVLVLLRRSKWNREVRTKLFLYIATGK